MKDDIKRCQGANVDGSRCNHPGKTHRMGPGGIPYLVCGRHNKKWNGPYRGDKDNGDD